MFNIYEMPDRGPSGDHPSPFNYFDAEYGDTTYDQFMAAMNDGRTLRVRNLPADAGDKHHVPDQGSIPGFQLQKDHLFPLHQGSAPQYLASIVPRVGLTKKSLVTIISCPRPVYRWPIYLTRLKIRSIMQ